MSNASKIWVATCLTSFMFTLMNVGNLAPSMAWSAELTDAKELAKAAEAYEAQLKAIEPTPENLERLQSLLSEYQSLIHETPLASAMDFNLQLKLSSLEDEIGSSIEKGRVAAADRIINQRKTAKSWSSDTALGDGSLFLWRGWAIGDPREVVLAKEKVGICGPMVLGSDVEVCSLMPSGGVTTELHQLLFKNAKLVGFQYFFDEPNAVQVLDLLVERYGLPQQKSIVNLQTAAGAKFDSHDFTWNTPVGDLNFHERFRRIDSGAVELLAPIQSTAPKPF